MTYSLRTIRDQFPALQREYNGYPVAFFDGPSGSQVAQLSIDKMVNYMEQGSANLGSPYLTSQESDAVVASARDAMADFLGGGPDEIAFGQNMTSLAFALAHAMGRDWTDEDRIVVTELDHRANVDTWMTIAEEQGAEVEWIPLNTESLILDYSNLDSIITSNTRLVAIGHASNGVGTINNLDPVVERAKEVGAIVVVDAVHSAPHLFIDRDKMGADIVLCSGYKFFGPHIGVASIRYELFEQLQAYRISTAPQSAPGKLETGTQSFEAMAGLVGAIDFIASLGDGETRRDRIHDAFVKIHQHEKDLADKLRNYLQTKKDVTLYQAEVSKTPTVAFRIAGISPQDIVKYLDNYAIFAGAGHFYARTIADRLQLRDGWVRIGMAPYSSNTEVDRFITAIDDLLKTL